MQVQAAGVEAVSKILVAASAEVKAAKRVLEAGFGEALAAEGVPKKAAAVAEIAKPVVGATTPKAAAAEDLSKESTVTYSSVSAAKPTKAHKEQQQGGSSKDAGAAQKKSERKDEASVEDVGAPQVSVAPVIAVEQPTVQVLTQIVPVQTAPAEPSAAPVSEVKAAAALPKGAAVPKSASREASKAEDTDVSATGEAKAGAAVAPVTTAPKAVAAAAVVPKEDTSTAGIAVAPVTGVHVHAGAPKATVSAPVDTRSGEAPSAERSDVKTLIATPNVLEVGVASGSHGWLRVRAELGQMGEVTASVAAASAGAAEGLHKELPAISAYLAGERVGVSALVVNAMDQGAGSQEATMGAGSGAQGDADRGGQERRERMAQADTMKTGVDFEFSDVSLPAAVYANGSGSWLSVRV